MDGMVAIIPLAFVVLAIILRIVAGGLDRDRVEQYIKQQGGKLLEAEWSPFGKGWWGEQSDRIYRVRFLDNRDNEHEATCKTSLFTGVYFTDD